MYGVVVKSNGEIFKVEFKELDYEILKKAVGGWIEVAYLKNGFAMVVNEEGLFLNLPKNRIASAVHRGGYIVGDVIFVKIGVVNDENDLVGMEDIEAEKLISKFVSM